MMECRIGLHSNRWMNTSCAIGCATQAGFPRYPKRDWRECIMKPSSESGGRFGLCAKPAFSRRRIQVVVSGFPLLVDQRGTDAQERVGFGPGRRLALSERDSLGFVAPAN